MKIDIPNIILQDAIEREKAGIGFVCSGKDRIVFETMVNDINTTLGTNIHYLAEFWHYSIRGAGIIMVKYLNQFESPSVRCYLYSNIVADLVENCSDIMLEQYIYFKHSKEYRARNSYAAFALDHAFRKLKPKKLKKQLVELIQNPKDAYFLPFTTKMLASWKLSDMEQICIKYLQNSYLTIDDFDFESDFLLDKNRQFILFANKQLLFTALSGLKYFPSEDNMQRIKPFLISSDNDIAKAAKKTLQYYNLKTEDGSSS